MKIIPVTRELSSLHRICGFILLSVSIWILSPAVYSAAQTEPEPPATARQQTKDNLDDSAITANVKEALANDRDTSGASDAVHVLTSRGIVTLTGDVTSQATAEHAQKVVAQVTGVRDVVDDLKYPHMTESNPNVFPPAGSTKY